MTRTADPDEFELVSLRHGQYKTPQMKASVLIKELDHLREQGGVVIFGADELEAIAALLWDLLEELKQ